MMICSLTIRKFQHTAARRRLLTTTAVLVGSVLFQHTAARRRLLSCDPKMAIYIYVSTHSRTEAAAPD